jgi:preprotein translocase subunit SecY
MHLFALSVSPVLCAMSVVQLLGLVAAGLARLSEGTRHERGCQWLLVVALAAVGALCGFALQFGPASAAFCAVTLTLMTMIAIFDTGPRG